MAADRPATPAPTRRGVVALLGGLACAAARGRAKDLPRRIGFLASGSAAATAPAFDMLRAGLRDRGWIEGSNLVVESRYADGRFERLRDLAAELVRADVELIVALPTPATLAAHQAAPRIPIVGVSVADPVALGLAKTLARPGGHVTGLTFSVGLEVWGKQLELLKEAVPAAHRVAVLANPANPGHVLGRETLRSAARSLNLELLIVEAGSPEAIDTAFAAIANPRADAVVVLGDSMFSSQADRIGAWLTRLRLPSAHGTRQNVESGGLLSYAPDLRFQLRQAAGFVDRILKGSAAGDLPFEQPTKFEFIVNLKTARTLGLTLPSRLMLRADQVIE